MFRRGGLQGFLAWIRGRVLRFRFARAFAPGAGAFTSERRLVTLAMMTVIGVGGIGAIGLGLLDHDRAWWLADGPPPGLERRAVLEVIDGDTLVVEGLGTVRILGIDTPETRHPDMDGPQPLGPAATARLRSLVEGEQVRLEQDVEPLDHFGRALRHVWIGRRLVSEILAEEGLAHSLFIAPNLRHSRRIRAATARARAARSGLWGLARPTPLPIFEAISP